MNNNSNNQIPGVDTNIDDFDFLKGRSKSDDKNNINNSFNNVPQNSFQKDFLTSIIIHGKERIPSDTFKIDSNQFMLMDISVNLNTKKITLEIMGSEGDYLSDKILISPEEIEIIEVESFFNKFEEVLK